MTHEASGVTVVIPTIPPRLHQLHRALDSVMAQTIQPDAISIALDTTKAGAGPTRQRALMGARTEWIAFLDDDDELLPTHLSALLAGARMGVGAGEADVIWPWFEVIGGTDPFPQHHGRQWDPTDPHIFPITALVRTRFAQQATFPAPGDHADWHGDDFPYWLQLHDLGARFLHIGAVTWRWHHHGLNTSGLPSRW